MTESSRSKTLEVMARGIATRHYAARFGKSASDPHVVLNVDANWWAWEADAAAALTAYESHLQAEGMAVVPGWQPIESAPKDAVILVVDADGDVNKASWGDCCPGYPNSPNMKWCVACSHSEYGYVTTKAVAWMPLPPASPYGKAVVKEKDDE